jgi:ATP-binding cassette subfamily C (CFTR/MRP) protein 4
LVLDGATANVDIETDDFIQKKIREKFPDATILTIAHRLTTIADHDKVMIMEKGKIEEFDHPYLLLVKKKGDMKITKQDGAFAKLVLKNGDEIADKVFTISKGNYYFKNPIKPLISTLVVEHPKLRGNKKKTTIMGSNFSPLFEE